MGRKVAAIKGGVSNPNPDVYQYNNNCKHHIDKYYRHNPPGPWNSRPGLREECLGLAKDLMLNIGNLTNGAYIKFIDYISIEYSNYNGRCGSCIMLAGNKLLPTIDAVLSVYTPTMDQLVQFMKYPIFDKVVVKVINENDIKFKVEQFLYVLDERFRFSNQKNPEDDKLIIDCLFDNFQPENNKYIGRFMKVRHLYFNTKLVKYIGSDMPKDNKLSYDSCIVLPYSLPIIKQFELDDKCLEIVCKYGLAKEIKLILELTRITVTKIHIRGVLQCKNYLGFTNEYKRRNKMNFKRYDMHGNCDDDGYRDYNRGDIGDQNYNDRIVESLKVLLNTGYTITREDVILAISKQIQIPEIERYNINFDQDLLDKCWDVDFYPSYNFKCITKNGLELQKLCREKQKVKIAKFIKENNIVPDRKCLDNAVRHRNNKQCVELLLSKGAKVVFNTVKLSAANLASNKTLMILLDDFEKNYVLEVQQYKDKIAELESKLEKNGLKLDPEIKTIVEEPQVPLSSQSEEQMDKEEILEIITLDDKTGNLPKQLRRKMNVPEKYKKYFELDSKMSFLDIKKHFINNIKANKWYNNDIKTLVDIPKDLRKILEIKMVGYIQFKDMEKLLAYFY